MLKKIQTTLALFAISIGTLLAQTPQGINYQAVARDGNGDLITNGSLDVKVGIYSGVNGTAKEYEETHSGVSTDDYGHFAVIIGEGAAGTGTFTNIDWGAAKHFIQVSIDNGNGFQNLGKVALQSAPYALHAGSVDQIPTINVGDLGDVSSSAPATGQVLKWDGTEWAPANDNSGSGGSLTAGVGINLAGNTIEAKNGDAIWNANKLRGRDIGTATPNNGDFLKWNGSLWEPAAPNNTSYTAGTGLTLTGSTFSANNTTALWNADKLQGRNIASTAPSNNQVLQWNGSAWTPATVSAGGWSTIGTQYVYSRRNVAVGTDTALTRLHVIDTITATAQGNYANTLIETEASRGQTASTYGIWNTVTGRNGYENVGIRSYAGDSANSIYVGGGATGGHFLAYSIGGQNNFGVLSQTGENATARNYGVYSHSRGDGQFNMGVFALADKSSNSATITNYGIYAMADSAQTNYAGYFAGDVTYTGSLSSASDARFKEEVAPVENALGLVKDLNVKSYYFKKTGDAAKMNLSSGRQYGFIAQELEAVIPELVSTQKHAVGVQDGEEPEVIEFKGVNYIGLIPVLTKAIQEQQAMIEVLQQRIEELENQ